MELISPEKARQYVEELGRLKELRQICEQKRRELAAADTPQAQARIALEIRRIDAELNAPHLIADYTSKCPFGKQYGV